MRKVTAANHQEAESYLSLGDKIEVELAFNISADEFFMIASDWCERGAKIKKVMSSSLYISKIFSFHLMIDYIRKISVDIPYVAI